MGKSQRIKINKKKTVFNNSNKFFEGTSFSKGGFIPGEKFITNNSENEKIIFITFDESGENYNFVEYEKINFRI